MKGLKRESEIRLPKSMGPDDVGKTNPAEVAYSHKYPYMSIRTWGYKQCFKIDEF